jgi:hypothetical protein
LQFTVPHWAACAFTLSSYVLFWAALNRTVLFWAVRGCAVVRAVEYRVWVCAGLVCAVCCTVCACTVSSVFCAGGAVALVCVVWPSTPLYHRLLAITLACRQWCVGVWRGVVLVVNAVFRSAVGIRVYSAGWDAVGVREISVTAGCGAVLKDCLFACASVCECVAVWQSAVTQCVSKCECRLCSRPHAYCCCSARLCACAQCCGRVCGRMCGCCSMRLHACAQCCRRMYTQGSEWRPLRTLLREFEYVCGRALSYKKRVSVGYGVIYAFSDSERARWSGGCPDLLRSWHWLWPLLCPISHTGE